MKWEKETLPSGDVAHNLHTQGLWISVVVTQEGTVECWVQEPDGYPIASAVVRGELLKLKTP